MAIKVNIKELEDKKKAISTASNYYSQKASTFTFSSFNSSYCSTLGNYLSKINKIYKDISKNLNSTSIYLTNYIVDIKNVENKYKKTPDVVTHKLDKTPLFTINKVDSSKSSITGFSDSLSELTSLGLESLDAYRVINGEVSINDLAEDLFGSEESKRDLLEKYYEVNVEEYEKALSLFTSFGLCEEDIKKILYGEKTLEEVFDTANSLSQNGIAPMEFVTQEEYETWKNTIDKYYSEISSELSMLESYDYNQWWDLSHTSGGNDWSNWKEKTITFARYGGEEKEYTIRYYDGLWSNGADYVAPTDQEFQLYMNDFILRNANQTDEYGQPALIDSSGVDVTQQIFMDVILPEYTEKYNDFLNSDRNVPRAAVNEYYQKELEMSEEEYLYRIQCLTQDKLTIESYGYSIRQRLKECPYLEIQRTDEYKDWLKTQDIESIKSRLSSELKPEIILNEDSDTAFGSYMSSLSYENKIQEYIDDELLSDDEIIFCEYLFSTKGKDEVDAYLEAIKDRINQRLGRKQAEEFLSELNYDSKSLSTLQTFFQGFGDGVESFGEGIENVFNADGVMTDNNYEAMYIIQGLTSNKVNYINELLVEMEKEDPQKAQEVAVSLMNSDGSINMENAKSLLNSSQYENLLTAAEHDKLGAEWLSEVYNVGSSVGNMAIPTFVSVVLKAASVYCPPAGIAAESLEKIIQGTSLTMLGLSAGGNARNQALIDGKSESEALALGIWNGLSEVALEKLLGGIEGLADDIGNPIVAILKEGFEEYTQEYVDRGASAVIHLINGGLEGRDLEKVFNESIGSLDGLSADARKAFIYGCISTVLLNGSTTVLNGGIELAVNKIKITVDGKTITLAQYLSENGALNQEINNQLSQQLQTSHPNITLEQAIETINNAGIKYGESLSQEILEKLNKQKNAGTPQIEIVKNNPDGTKHSDFMDVYEDAAEGGEGSVEVFNSNNYKIAASINSSSKNIMQEMQEAMQRIDEIYRPGTANRALRSFIQGAGDLSIFSSEPAFQGYVNNLTKPELRNFYNMAVTNFSATGSYINHTYEISLDAFRKNMPYLGAMDLQVENSLSGYFDRTLTSEELVEFKRKLSQYVDQKNVGEIIRQITTNQEIINRIPIDPVSSKEALAIAQTKKFIQTKLKDILKDFWGESVHSQIETIDKKIEFITNEEMAKYGWKTNVAGLQVDDRILINSDFAIEQEGILQTFATHESNHKIFRFNIDINNPEWMQFIGNVNYKGINLNNIGRAEMTGLSIHIYDSYGNDRGTLFRGINEVLTELFTAKQLGDEYIGHSENYFNYFSDGIEVLQQMVNSGIVSMDTLKAAYKEHNIYLIMSEMYETFNRAGLNLNFWQLISSFDDAIDSDNNLKVSGLVALNNIIGEYLNNTSNIESTGKIPTIDEDGTEITEKLPIIDDETTAKLPVIDDETTAKLPIIDDVNEITQELPKVDSRKSILRSNANSIYAKFSNFYKKSVALFTVSNMVNALNSEGNGVIWLLEYTNPSSKYYNNIDALPIADYIKEDLKEMSVLDVKEILFRLGYNSKRSTFSFFNSMREANTFGIDQGMVYDLYNYEYGGKKYNFREAMDIINESMEKGLIIPKFTIDESGQEYQELKRFVMSKGFSAIDASIILTSLDATGACTYAATVNRILTYFNGRETEFKNHFGYTMYTVNENGTRILNANKLLVDLYIYANTTRESGPSRFINSDNSININALLYNSPANIPLINGDFQVYLAGDFGDRDRIIKNYLFEKGLDYASESYICTGNKHQDEMSNLIQNAKDAINSGLGVSLNIYPGGYPIEMISMDPLAYSSNSTEGWKCGHAVTIVAANDNFFTVSSWGSEYIIYYDDLYKNGNFSIIISDIFHRD